MKIKALKVMKYIYKQIRIPIAIFALFFFAGFGFYRGFVSAHMIDIMHGGKVILIHAVDLGDKEDE